MAEDLLGTVKQPLQRLLGGYDFSLFAEPRLQSLQFRVSPGGGTPTRNEGHLAILLVFDG
jgi:hypothetical protein